MTRWVVIDTNVLLHFQRLDDAQWADLCPCVFVIPATVIAEVDRHKQSNSARLQRRARSLLPWLERNDHRELGNGSQLVLRATEPHRTLADHETLDRHHPDDRIIATAIELAGEHPGDEVILVSDDTAPRIKARHYNVRAQQPKDELRLAPSKTKEEQELDEARRRLQLLENRSANLVVEIDSDEESFHVGPESEGDNEERLQKALKEQQEELGGACTERYLRKYAKYLRESDVVYDQVSRCIRIPLAVSNHGSHHADDVLVQIEWEAPPAFLLEMPEFPHPPEKPRDPFGFPIQTLNPPFFDLASRFDRDKPKGPLGHNGDHQVAYQVPRLVHGTSVSLEPLCVMYDSLDAVRGLTLNWSIHAAHQPDATRGALHVRVGKERDHNGLWRFLGWEAEDDLPS